MSESDRPSLEEYRHHIAKASATQNYFIFRECYLDIMTRDAALVIQKLINRYSYLLKKNKLRADEFFPYTGKHLERSLRMKRDCQTRVLNELQGVVRGGVEPDKAFIAVRKMGQPARRYVWIDFLALNRAIDTFQENGGNPVNGKPRCLDNGGGNPVNGKSRCLVNGKSRCPYINEIPKGISKRKKVKNPPLTPPQGGRERLPISFGRKVEKTFAQTLSEELMQGFADKKKILRLHNEKRNLPKWSEAIDKLIPEVMSLKEMDQTSAESYVRSVFTFHVENIDDQFQPNLYSACTMCSKWPKVENAYKRSRQKRMEQLPAEIRFVKTEDGRSVPRPSDDEIRAANRWRDQKMREKFGEERLRNDSSYEFWIEKGKYETALAAEMIRKYNGLDILGLRLVENMMKEQGIK